MPENEEAAPAAEAQQDVAQPSDTTAEATSTAKASDELSEDDLEAVAGGKRASIHYKSTRSEDAGGRSEAGGGGRGIAT